MANHLGSEKEEMERVFKVLDKDGDGKISESELGTVVRALGSHASPGEVRTMIDEMDADHDGFVNIKEFADFNRGGGGGREDAEAELRIAFDMYDLDRNGLISASELHLVLKRLGDKSSARDCTRMIGSVDADGDGCVNFEEFKKMMSPGGAAKKASSPAGPSPPPTPHSSSN